MKTSSKRLVRGFRSFCFLMRQGVLAGSLDASRRHAQEFSENQPHVLAALDAGAVDNLFQRYVGFQQQGFRTRRTAMLDFLKDCPACGLFEPGFKRPAATTDMGRHFLDVDRRVGVIYDELARPPRDAAHLRQRGPFVYRQGGWPHQPQ